jgi:hypothetical protein
MSDYANVVSDHWYWDAFDALRAENHLDQASVKVMGGSAHGRLSVFGRLYLEEKAP